jgi:hypothetical protein
VKPWEILALYYTLYYADLNQPERRSVSIAQINIDTRFGGGAGTTGFEGPAWESYSWYT